MPLSSRNLRTGYAILSVLLVLPIAGALIAQAAPGRKRSSKASARKAVAAKPALTGEAIYQQSCVSCHGPNGEGTEDYSRPLVGEKSVGELAPFISQSMPPGARKKMPLADAQKVAAYIHGAFYSPIARERNRPARVELSRLTVRQYRNAVADLVGSFLPAAPPVAEDARGLKAEYFKSRNFRNNERVLERVDPQVQFDFSNLAPTEALDPRQFSIRWQGAVVAPETGEYEFIVRTEHAARLYVNDNRKPLVDAWVKSGNDSEFKASIFLLGGRAYPLRLEFSKADQGVDMSDKNKERPVAPSAIKLDWRLPKRVAEPIPQRSLLPAGAPEAFVVATPFPPDDRSIGYERGVAISRAWDDAATQAAIETAGYVTENLKTLSGVPDDAPDRDARLRDFCRRFVTRAFRRPLTAEQAAFFVDRRFEGAPDKETAVERVVLMTLKSPHFLYRELNASAGNPDAYDVASRLSFGLWDSLPDTELLRAAAAGELSTREQVARQAERMAGDRRAEYKLRDFFLQWLKVEHNSDMPKDPKRFPGFDDTVASDLRTSLDLFVEERACAPDADLRQILLTNKLFLNGRLAKIYGVKLPANAPFQEVALPATERAGVLTHPYVLSSNAYLTETSPIHRGVLVARNILGRTLLPPPEAFAPLSPNLHPNLTTRQRVALQTKPPACASCHVLINPLGFTMEQYDAIGRLRAQEQGKPVDASGGYRSPDGKTVKFNGAKDLARFLADSDEVHAAFAEQLFQHLVKQPVRAYGPKAKAELQQSFAKNHFNIRRQVIDTMAATALHG